jgi:hypothetical protein
MRCNCAGVVSVSDMTYTGNMHRLSLLLHRATHTCTVDTARLASCSSAAINVWAPNNKQGGQRQGGGC